MESHGENKVQGAESILLHNCNIVLGMQKPDRWYIQDNGTKASIIKTIGGKIEVEDNDNSRNAVKREILEEINGISVIKIGEIPIFSKSEMLKKLNPYEKDSCLTMEADFYIAEIDEKDKLYPNDLPALVEIPIKKFLNFGFGKSYNLSNIKKYIIKNTKLYSDLIFPSEYAIMAPYEIKKYLENTLNVDNK